MRWCSDSADDLAKGTQVAVSVRVGIWFSSSTRAASISSRRALRCSSLRPLFGSKLTSKELDQVLGDGRVCEQGVRHEGRGVAQAQLNQVVVQGTEQTYFLPGQALSQDQAVQGIGLALTRAGRRSGHPRTGKPQRLRPRPPGFNSEVVG